MVGVQHEDAVQRAFEHRIDLVFLAWRTKHHAQEVAGIRQLIARVHVGLALAVFVGHGHQRRHFGNQSDGRNLAVLRVVDVGAVMVEGRQRAHQACQHSHGVRIAAKTAQEELQLFVDHGVVQYQLVKVRALAGAGQLALEQQVAGVEVIAVGGQLLDGVAAVQQLAFVTVNVGDGRLARSSRQKTWVVGEHAGLPIQLADVNHVRTNGALVKRHVHAGGAVAEGQGGFVVN